jgi:hypothetical protein
MSDPVFIWRDGPAPPGIDPKDAAQELRRIYHKYGDQLVPKDVVIESRPKNAPLHAGFEWDNAVAGDHWRLYQARHIIKAVNISYPDGSREPVWVHATIMRPGNVKHRFYQDAKVLVTRADEYDSAIQAATRALAQANERLAVLRAMAKARHKSKSHMATLVLIGDALGTARGLAEQLQ